MGEQVDMLFSRLAWFTAVAIVVAYVASALLGGIVNAKASGQNDPVFIRDKLHANEHDLSGMIMVPTPCDELSVQTESISQTDFALLFKTWHEPSVTCNSDATPRAFEAVLFAPATGVTFTATLNNKDIPVAVVPISTWPN